MSARRTISALIVISITSLLVFFNNCAKKSDDTSAASEVVTATDLVGPLQSGFRLTTMDGKVQGWAMDKGKPASILRVYFYLGGPASTGTYLGEAIANIRSVGPYEGHFFEFQVPANLIDGQPHPLYVYAHKAVDENTIYPSPYSIVGYKAKAEQFFNQNIAPFISSNNCVSCHRTPWTHQSLFDSLSNPYPISGGTASNNRFNLKMNGGIGHSGGTFCNGAGAAFCTNIQAWWRAEFQ